MIEFYPSQKMKLDSDIVVGHDITDKQTKELLAERGCQGVHAVNCGMVKAKDAAEVNRIMAFAKKMGLYAVCTEATEQIVAWRPPPRKRM